MADDRTIDIRECLNRLVSSHRGRCVLQGCLPGPEHPQQCGYCGEPMMTAPVMGMPPISPLQSAPDAPRETS